MWTFYNYFFNNKYQLTKDELDFIYDSYIGFNKIAKIIQIQESKIFPPLNKKRKYPLQFIKLPKNFSNIVYACTNNSEIHSFFHGIENEKLDKLIVPFNFKNECKKFLYFPDYDNIKENNNISIPSITSKLFLMTSTITSYYTDISKYSDCKEDTISYILSNFVTILNIFHKVLLFDREKIYDIIFKNLSSFNNSDYLHITSYEKNFSLYEKKLSIFLNRWFSLLDDLNFEYEIEYAFLAKIIEILIDFFSLDSYISKNPLLFLNSHKSGKEIKEMKNIYEIIISLAIAPYQKLDDISDEKYLVEKAFENRYIINTKYISLLHRQYKELSKRTSLQINYIFEKYGSQQMLSDLIDNLEEGGTDYDY